MEKNNLNVREANENDIQYIADYWFNAAPDFLEGMGVDVSRMPDPGQFKQMLKQQIALPYEEKKAYALIWEVDGKPIGHTNVNPAVYGKEAYMHIHIWFPEERKKGNGSQLIKLSLPYYFKNLQLERVLCEPYALNPAPNKTLERLGFRFIKEYITTPGAITFEQPVKQWEVLRNEIITD